MYVAPPPTVIYPTAQPAYVYPQQPAYVVPGAAVVPHPQVQVPTWSSSNSKSPGGKYGNPYR